MRLYECLILPCYEFLVFSCQCEFLVFSCVNFLSSSVRMSFIIWSIRSQYVACHQLDQFFLCFFPTSSICTSVLNSFMPVRWRNISSAWGWVARVFESGRFQASSVSMISPTCLHTFDSESIPFHSIPISFFFGMMTLFPFISLLRHAHNLIAGWPHSVLFTTFLLQAFAQSGSTGLLVGMHSTNIW